MPNGANGITMKNVAFVAIVMTLFLWSACEKSAFTPSVPAPEPELRESVLCARVDFLTTENQGVGRLTIEEENDYLRFTFYGDEGWFFRRIHLYAGLLDNVPLSEGGIPKVGQFEYSQTYFPYPASDIFFIAKERIEAEEGCFIVACQAEIYYIVDGAVIDAQYVWAEGIPFNGNSSATYFEYCLGCEEPPPVIPPDDDPYDNLAPPPADSYQSVYPSQGPGAYTTAEPGGHPYRFPINFQQSKAPILKPGAYIPANQNTGESDHLSRVPMNARQNTTPVMKPGAYILQEESGTRSRIPVKALESKAPVLKPGEMEN